MSRPILSRPPWYFCLGKYLIRNRYRGGYRLIATAHRLGLLDALVRYRLSERVSFLAALYREANQWDLGDILAYEAVLLEEVVGALRAVAPGDVVCCDCGADIGIFTAVVSARFPRIARVLAFEPNPEAHEVLALNMRELPMPATAYQAAVGRASGKGQLRLPDYDNSSLASFIADTEEGDIPIVAIDDLSIERNCTLLLKLDVEGGEMDVIQGALRTLREVQGFVLTIEAHPLVVKRTGIDPCEILRVLSTVRPCRFLAAEDKTVDIDLAQPFFQQFDRATVYNIVVLSQTP